MHIYLFVREGEENTSASKEALATLGNIRGANVDVRIAKIVGLEDLPMAKVKGEDITYKGLTRIRKLARTCVYG